MFKLAIERWKIFGQVLADAQGVVFTKVFYFTIMLPFGIGMRLVGDPLAIKGTSEWLDREPVSTRIEDARRQG